MPPAVSSSPLPPSTPPLLPPPLAAWGLTLAEHLLIDGGLDPDAAVWQVRDDSGGLWAVKATRRDCRFGLALAASVGADVSVVAPVPTTTGRLWTEHEGSIVSVSPWVFGDDAAEDGRGLDDAQWTELGAVVRRIHDQAPPSDVAPLRRGVKRTGRRARVLLRDLDHRFVGRPDDPLAELWREHRGRLDRLERVALDLKATRTDADRVPCHGDPHLGNVVVDEAGRPWLIDLDEATVAPREVDLVLVELGVLPGLPMTEAHRSAFRLGYGDDVTLDDDRLVRFGCIRALEDVTATFSSLERAHSSQHGSDADGVQAGLRAQLGPLGLVSLVEARLTRA